MKKDAHQLLNELTGELKGILTTIVELKQLPPKQLNYKPSPEIWSILECVEHLNLYGDFYLPKIEQTILQSKHTEKSNYIFKSGILGNYFAKSMLPKQGVIKNKMKTFTDKNPANSNLTTICLDRFVKQIEKMIHLLEMAKTVNISKTKTAISISKLIRLKLGDTFRFNINHIHRHMFQIKNIKNSFETKI
ncbi:MAG: DinB family protein [Flavobacteriales bacterium]